MVAPQAACKTTCLRHRKRQAMLRSAPIIHRLPKLRHRLPATLETLGSYLTSLKRKLIIPIRQSRLWANATEALPETGEISINGPDAAHRQMNLSILSQWAKSRDARAHATMHETCTKLVRSSSSSTQQNGEHRFEPCIGAYALADSPNARRCPKL